MEVHTKFLESTGQAGHLDVRTPVDVIAARRDACESARAWGMGEFDTTRLGTAISELARRLVHECGGGTISWFLVRDGFRRGIRIEFADAGYGLAETQARSSDASALDGISEGAEIARRFVDALEIESSPGGGAKIAVLKWFVSARAA